MISNYSISVTAGRQTLFIIPATWLIISGLTLTFFIYSHTFSLSIFLLPRPPIPPRPLWHSAPFKTTVINGRIFCQLYPFKANRKGIKGTPSFRRISISGIFLRLIMFFFTLYHAKNVIAGIPHRYPISLNLFTGFLKLFTIIPHIVHWYLLICSLVSLNLINGIPQFLHKFPLICSLHVYNDVHIYLSLVV